MDTTKEKEIYLCAALRILDECGNSYSNAWCKENLRLINNKLGTNYPVIGKIFDIWPIWYEARMEITTSLFED